MRTAKVLYGATDLGVPEFSSDLLWRTRFRVPDPVFLIEIEGKTYLFVSVLEFGRAKKEAKVDGVVLSDGGAGQVMRFLKSKRVRQALVPHAFPYHIAKALKKEFRVFAKVPPFYPERIRKTQWEIAEIRAAQAAAGRALSGAVEFLASCRIRQGRIVSSVFGGVTSEKVRGLIKEKLLAQGYLGINTIVSCGAQAADPHAIGSSPLQAHQPIVIDIFPVSLRTHYYGDMTRTIFKGEPSRELQKMYEAVRQAQEQAVAEIRAGIDGSHLYKETLKFFESAGYPTAFTGKQPEGFIHGLGHGVGIDIHEPPSLGPRSWILEAGNVVTVEPGLYYPRRRDRIPAGGIRIEDTVVVEKDGCRNLSLLRKDLAHAFLP